MAAAICLSQDRVGARDDLHPLFLVRSVLARAGLPRIGGLLGLGKSSLAARDPECQDAARIVVGADHQGASLPAVAAQVIDVRADDDDLVGEIAGSGYRAASVAMPPRICGR